MKSYSYETQIPVMPGNEVENWQKTRKKQWKSIKCTLERLFIKKEEIKYSKEDYLALDLNGESHPMYWEPVPLIGMWLSPDQSDEMWDEIWGSLSAESKGWSYSFEKIREQFLERAHNGETDVSVLDQTYGAFGGLEQRLLKEFVRSEVYTDDLFKLGDNEYRKIPWKTPRSTFGSILFYNTDCFVPFKEGRKRTIYRNPYSPCQWLHNLLISTFDHDLHNDFDQQSVDAYCRRLKGMLSDDIQKICHPNHLLAGHRLIEIFEDEMAPKFLRDTWIKTRDGK